MYTRQQASKLRQEFWTAFGQYMAPVPGADGFKINWINYKTGVSQIYFRMNADSKSARIGIELTHNIPDLRHSYFEQFNQLSPIMEGILNEEWTWEKDVQDEQGRQFSWIGTEKTGTSIFRKEDWPTLISFFKPRMIALDEFWSAAKYSFGAPN